MTTLGEILAKFYICVCISLFAQEKYCEGAFENGTKKFDCRFTLSDKERSGFITCSFSLFYQRGELFLECFKNAHNNGMGIVFYKGKIIAEREKMIRNAVKCISNSPMSVKMGFNNGFTISSFTEIKQERIIDHYSNISSYKYQLNILLPKVEIRLHLDQRILIQYKISLMFNPNFETNVLLEFPSRKDSIGDGACGDRYYQLLKYSAIEVNSQEFIEIPFVGLAKNRLTLRRNICRGEFVKRCEEQEGDSIAWCFEFPKSGLMVMGDNIITSKHSYGVSAPLYSILNDLGLQDDRLVILRNDTLSTAEIRSLTERIIANSKERPIVVDNENLHYLSVYNLLSKLETITPSPGCIPKGRLTYEQLQFLLQELYITEVLIGDEDLLSYNPLAGFKVSSQLLMRYGPGTYEIWSTKSCLPGQLTIYFSDFVAFPNSSHIAVRFPMYTMFENKANNSLTLTCSSNSENVSISPLRTNVNKEADSFRDLDLAYSSYEVPNSQHRFHASAVLDLDLHAQRKTNFTVAHLECLPYGKHWILHNKGSVSQPFHYIAEKNLFVCSSGSDVVLRQWYCKNRMQCEIVGSNCLNNDAILNLKTFIFRFKMNALQLVVPPGVPTGNCMQSLIETRTHLCPEDFKSQYHTQCWSMAAADRGIVQCMVPSNNVNGFNIHYVYFKGFDDRLYIENEMSEPPPINATLKIDNLNPQNKFFVYGLYEFSCKAHPFFYDEGIQWFLLFMNETTKKIKSVKYLIEPLPLNDNMDYCESKIKITIPNTSLREIICSAPTSRTNQWNNISFKLHIIESIAPKITLSETKVWLREDVKDQGITCKASGTPEPNITWTKSTDKEIEEPLRVVDGNTLLFSIFNSSFAGVYLCNASNVAGYDTKEFYVKAKMENNDILSETIIGVTATLVLALILLYLAYYRHEKLKKYRELKEVIRLLNGSIKKESEADENEEDFNPINFPFNENYDIATNSFILDRRKILGFGEFGVVYKGLLDGIDRTVAFKTVHPDCEMVRLKALVSEVKILMYIGPHSNLINLLGVYRQEIKCGILYVAIEYCGLGSLESYLRKNKSNFVEYSVLKSETEIRRKSDMKENLPNCSLNSLIKWSKEIAIGMEFLTIKKVVHADLATRNVLLTSEGNAKVTDFGLSKRTYNYSEYVKSGKDPLPWRWSAIECFLTNTFSSKSDVWSYGITLWELFSLGDVPYPGMDYTLDFSEKLEKGLINTKPKWASDDIYNLMIRCWHLNPDERPNFSSLKAIFETVEDSLNNSIEIDIKVFFPENIDTDAMPLSSMDYVTV